MSDGEFVPIRMGSHHSLVCPCGVFKGPQGWIVILVLDRQWANICKAMDKPDLIADPRFATNADRAKNQQELIPIIEEWMQTQPSDAAVLQVFEDQRVPSAAVMSITDILQHPYFKARDMVRTVPDPVLGEVTIPGFPLKYSEFPQLLDIQAPLLGQHSADVLREQLSYTDEQIAALRDAGVLYAEDR